MNTIDYVYKYGGEILREFNPVKLTVEFGECVTPEEPIIPRKYTLTHSDITAELFLNIDSKYAYDKINETRDEVLAEWKEIDDEYILYVHVYVGWDFDFERTSIRNKIFTEELPLALQAIYYGDKDFFTAHPELNEAAVWVYFESTLPCFNKMDYWGKISDYSFKNKS